LVPLIIPGLFLLWFNLIPLVKRCREFQETPTAVLGAPRRPEQSHRTSKVTGSASVGGRRED